MFIHKQMVPERISRDGRFARERAVPETESTYHCTRRKNSPMPKCSRATSDPAKSTPADSASRSGRSSANWKISRRYSSRCPGSRSRPAEKSTWNRTVRSRCRPTFPGTCKHKRRGLAPDDDPHAKRKSSNQTKATVCLPMPFDTFRDRWVTGALGKSRSAREPRKKIRFRFGQPFPAGIEAERIFRFRCADLVRTTEKSNQPKVANSGKQVRRIDRDANAFARE